MIAALPAPSEVRWTATIGLHAYRAHPRRTRRAIERSYELLIALNPHTSAGGVAIVLSDDQRERDTQIRELRALGLSAFNVRESLTPRELDMLTQPSAAAC